MGMFLPSTRQQNPCWNNRVQNNQEFKLKEKSSNWLPVDYRLKQCLASNAFEFVNNKCALHMKDFFDKSCISQASTGNSTKKIQLWSELYLFLDFINLEQLAKLTKLLRKFKYI